MQRKRLTPRNYVVFLLGRREYSERELRARLKLRECTQDEIEDALSFVKELDLQSDARYAASKSRMESRRKGDRVIRHTLARQGISAERVEQELSALAPEAERVLEAIRHFEGKPFDIKMKGRVWRFLTSRGFSGDAIQAAFTHLKGLP